MKLAITVNEAAKLSPYGKDAIYRFIKEDETFPAIKDGRKFIIPTRAFEEWLCMRARERRGL